MMMLITILRAAVGLWLAAVVLFGAAVIAYIVIRIWAALEAFGRRARL